MPRTRIFMLTMAASLCVLNANAQTEAPETEAAAEKTITEKQASEAKFIRAQFVRPGDVSPAEYARLLKEAERIRAYQAAQAPAGSQVIYNAASQNQGYIQAQTQQQTQQQTLVQTYQNPAQQQPQVQTFAPAQTVTPPQSYADYMASRGQQVVQSQAQQQSVYVQQQPVFVQQQVQPRTVQNFQVQNPNAVTYAAMPNVMGPASAGTPGTQFVAAQYGHAVIKGDTLYNISKRYGVKLNALKQANGLTGDIISIGQTLVIPGAMATQVPVTYQYQVPAPQQPTQIYQRTQTSPQLYIQQPQPAQQRTSVQQQTYNPVTGYTRTIATTPSGTSFIRSVQAVPPSGLYAVLPKDTLYSIAKFACVRPEEVARINGISNAATLQPGQKLTMPAGHCL